MELANAYRFQLTYGEYSRQMEQKLQIQKQNYEELTEKMDEISRMRHDMRHHLRTIMSYTQQGKYQEMMEYLQEYASVITEGEKLICYCRNMAVDAVIHFYAGELREKGIPFECDMMLPQNIGISDTDLCKIYGNLLENAVFHAKGMTELTLSVSLVGDKAVFEVADNGCGIPDDALQKIFTGSYEKSAAPVDGTRSNMGIGLSVCAAIVKAHGSEITAENRKGGGAVFRFALERGGEDDGQ